MSAGMRKRYDAGRYGPGTAGTGRTTLCLCGRCIVLPGDRVVQHERVTFGGTMPHVSRPLFPQDVRPGRLCPLPQGERGWRSPYR
jgi:hypothetical protein